MPVVLKSLNST